VLLATSQYAWNAIGIPALTGYDAGGHAGYILTIVEEGRLPDPHSGWSTFHPPLYYLIGSAVWKLLEPVGPAAIAAGLRAIGALAALGAGLVAYFLVRRRADWKVAWVATALVLFVPTDQMATAMIGNEALAAGLGALALPPLLALQRDPRSARHAALAALFAGLAFATKYNAAFVVFACAIPFLRRDFDRRMLRALAAGAAIGAIIVGPVYARNLLLTGTPFPVTRSGVPVESVEDANVLRPRKVVDYLWIDPACLLRRLHRRAPAKPGHDERLGARLRLDLVRRPGPPHPSGLPPRWRLRGAAADTAGRRTHGRDAAGIRAGPR
jgi:hypothetical protein